MLTSELLIKMVQQDVEHWKLAKDGDPDLDAGWVAFHLYHHVGYGRRFGLLPEGEALCLLNDREVMQEALQYMKESDFLSFIQKFLGEGVEAVCSIIHLAPAGMSKKEMDEDMKENVRMIEDTELESVIIHRDWFECACREIARHLPDDAEFSRHLVSVDCNLARADEVMHGALDRFVHVVPLMIGLLGTFIPKTIDRVREWWFFDIEELATGKIQLKDFTYGCTDPVRFPHFRIADYLGDAVKEEKPAVEAHLAQCASCREVVESAKK